MYETIGLLAVLAFIYAATSGWFEKTPINGALIYTAFGVIFGTAGVGALELEVSAEALRLIAEVTTAAQSLGGSGFIAAFCGGLLFGTYLKEDKEELLEPAEATGGMFSLITWTVFGAAVVGPSLGNFSIEILVYAIASLTVIRMLPVYLSLLGTKLDVFERLFAGWFGPRGLASIVFGVIVLGERLPGIEVITMTVICTVLLSVILHGVSANPLVAVMAERTKTKGDK